LVCWRPVLQQAQHDSNPKFEQAKGDQVNDLSGYGQKSYGVLLLYATSIMALPAQTLTTLHSFDFTDGTQPLSGLVQSASGSLYGTTYPGGLAGTGTVFEITPGGVFSTVGNLVAVLPTGMILATNGNLYGTTVSGNGTVFEISSSGLAIRHTFDGADGSVPGELVQAAYGSIYGVAGRGGANGDGTVFTINLSDALTTPYNFNRTDGAGALGLLQAINGKFYGITTAGGANNDGTVFEIRAVGACTTLHSFDATDRSSPAGLIQAANSNFYGTTSYGAARNAGIVFEITPRGAFASLHTFHVNEGYPFAPLIQATDGNFHGTTYAGGGVHGDGTVFRITPDGRFTTVYRFCIQAGCADGIAPWERWHRTPMECFTGQPNWPQQPAIGLSSACLWASAGS
jgi:uncharacterized repeat protein (TIGR03803 family)